MSSLDVWAKLNELGYTIMQLLLTVLWQSTILLAAIGLIAWTLRKCRASARQALWVTALLALPALLFVGESLVRAGVSRAQMQVLPGCVASETDLTAPTEPESDVELGATQAIPPKQDLSNLPRPWRKANELYCEIGELIGNGSFDEALTRIGDAEKELPDTYAQFTSIIAKRLRVNQDNEKTVGYLCGNLGVPKTAIVFLEEHQGSLKGPDRGIDIAIAGLLLEAGEVAEARAAYEKLLATGGESMWIRIFERRLDLIDAMEREPESFDVLLWSAQDGYKGYSGPDTWESLLGPVLQLDKALEHAENGYEQAAVIQKLVAWLRKSAYGSDPVAASVWEAVLPKEIAGSLAAKPGFCVERVKERYARKRFEELLLDHERRERSRVDLEGYRLGEFGTPREAESHRRFVKHLIAELGSTESERALAARRKLVLLRTRALDSVIEALSSDNPRLRRHATDLLPEIARGKRNRDRAMAELLAAIDREEDERIRNGMSATFTRFRGSVPAERLVPYILEGLSSADRNMRELALFTCTRYPRPECLDKIMELAAWEEDTNSLALILMALGKFRDDRAASAIAKHVEHPQLRRTALDAIEENHSGLDHHFLAKHGAYEAMADLYPEDLWRADDVKRLLRKAIEDTSLSERHHRATSLWERDRRVRRALATVLLGEVDRWLSRLEKRRAEIGCLPVTKEEERITSTLSIFGPYADLFPGILSSSRPRLNPARVNCWEANTYFFMNPSRLGAAYVVLSNNQGAEPCLRDWIEGMSVRELDETIEKIKTLAVFKKETSEEKEGPASRLVNWLKRARQEPIRSALVLEVEMTSEKTSYYGIEPIHIRLKLTNKSDSILQMPSVHQCGDSLLHWQIIDECGQSSSPRFHPDCSWEGEPPKETRLRYGESVRAELDIGKAFPWDRPGQFRVRAKFGYKAKPHSNWHGYVTSDYLSVTVRPVDFRDNAVLDEIAKHANGSAVNLPKDGNIETTRESVLLSLFERATDEGKIELFLDMIETQEASQLPRHKDTFFRVVQRQEDQGKKIGVLAKVSQKLPEAYFYLGYTYCMSGETGKASESLQKYLESGKDEGLRAQALHYLVQCLLEQGEIEEGIGQALKAEAIYRKSGNGLDADRMLGVISGAYEALGDLERALVALQSVDEKNLAKVGHGYDEMRSRLRSLRERLSRLRN